LYRYRTDAAQKTIQEYAKSARKNRMTLMELALRWTKQRPLITTIHTLFGHSNNLQQLEESLKYFPINEPLSEEVMWDIDMVHMRNRLLIFSSNRVSRDRFGSGEKIP
jgi:aryl-alcohol dehydrogenase-like predicted oxidoreductase